MPGAPRVRRTPLRTRGRQPRDPGGTCAVIMCAFEAKREWILKAIESVQRQLERPGWTYELRLGVDGCEHTSELLLEAGIGHWMSEENVGPYILRNSLIGLEEAEAYAPFDCDDVMKRPYLRELLGWIGSGAIAGAGRTSINADGRVRRRRSRFEGGVCVMSRGAWEKVGGYRPWPMAADHDLIIRAKKLRVPVKNVREPLYFRRRHPNSLTMKLETKIGSPARNQLWERAKELCAKGIELKIHPRTVELERREP